MNGIPTAEAICLIAVHEPASEIWESLANFARRRRVVDPWCYDVAAFSEEPRAAYETLRKYYLPDASELHLTQH